MFFQNITSATVVLVLLLLQFGRKLYCLSKGLALYILVKNLNLVPLKSYFSMVYTGVVTFPCYKIYIKCILLHVSAGGWLEACDACVGCTSMFACCL